jgi:hypothetical protein
MHVQYQHLYYQISCLPLPSDSVVCETGAIFPGFLTCRNVIYTIDKMRFCDGESTAIVLCCCLSVFCSFVL